MGTGGQLPVLAEVLLRHPGSSSVLQVARFLHDHGLEVTSMGRASLSVPGSAMVFESLFQTRLHEAVVAPPRSGARSFGVQRHAAYETDAPLEVPPEIADEVEGVYLQKPGQWA